MPYGRKGPSLMKTRKRLLLRGMLAFVAIACLLLLTVSTAFADGSGATTFTQTFHNQVDTMSSENPCTHAPGTVTLTYNGVFHFTVNKAGDFWDTGNQTGDFVFIPDVIPGVAPQPSYTGHFHFWFGDSINNRNMVDHSTFQVNGVGSDGSTLQFHEVAHFSVSASGMVETFDKPTCG